MNLEIYNMMREGMSNMMRVKLTQFSHHVAELGPIGYILVPIKELRIWLHGKLFLLIQKEIVQLE